MPADGILFLKEGDCLSSFNPNTLSSSTGTNSSESPQKIRTRVGTAKRATSAVFEKFFSESSIPLLIMSVSAREEFLQFVETEFPEELQNLLKFLNSKYYLDQEEVASSKESPVRNVLILFPWFMASEQYQVHHLR